MKHMRSTLATLGALLGAVVMSGAGASTMANTQTGMASWYQMGHTTANGERYNPDAMTAAHRTLPFGTVVQVTNLNNGRSVRLRINDRGPFVGGRIIDVSRGGARHLGLIGSGTARVRVTTLYSGGRTAGVSSGTDKKLACEAFGDCFSG
jgi:rare lipoprotein A